MVVRRNLCEPVERSAAPKARRVEELACDLTRRAPQSVGTHLPSPRTLCGTRGCRSVVRLLDRPSRRRPRRRVQANYGLCADDRPPQLAYGCPRKLRLRAACRRLTAMPAQARKGNDGAFRKEIEHQEVRVENSKMWARLVWARGELEVPAGRPAVSPTTARCNFAHVEVDTADPSHRGFAAALSRSMRRRHSEALAIQRRTHSCWHFLRLCTVRTARSPMAYGGVGAVTSCD